MISGILVFNISAELIISRFYKNDFSRVAAEAFRTKVISSKNFTSPVVLLDNSTFMYIRFHDLLLVAVTKRNANAGMVFAFLYQFLHTFQSYFGADFDEVAIRSNFVLVYELFDEVMDHGYPQIVNVELLQRYIHNGEASEVKANEFVGITNVVTGAIDWREEGKYQYQKNEVYLDVIENVNVQINQEGKTLSSDVRGRIVMKSQLSGMPTCRFGLNDKIAMQKRREARGSKRKQTAQGIDLEDVTFHRCVKLTRYDEDKTIMFVPPDGEFDLMTYRIKEVNLPFSVSANVLERGRNRVEYHVKVKAMYETFVVAENIEIYVPVPSNTNSCNVKTTGGRCQYVPTKHALVWTMKKLTGGQSIVLRGDVSLTHLIQDRQWARPPITMQFSIPMWPASGIKVRFLNVQETRLNYKSIKWVRYLTNAGDYQIRI